MTNQSQVHANDGEETWYRTAVKLPSGSYHPTTGQWNWLIEWHNDGHTTSFNPSAVSIAFGIYTDYPVVTDAYGANPHLVLRLMGGNTMSPSVYTCSLPPSSFSYDHWYDLRFHFVWSSDPTKGLAEWSVDGAPVCSLRFPTVYANPDGTKGSNIFGLYNYRLHASWPSQVDFDGVSVGPSATSVG